MVGQLKGRQRLLRLWLDQEGFCPICQTKITSETGWHVHHITRRVDGGSDNPSNLVLVHQNCHNLIHVRGIEVVKPVPARGL
ncbi:TPA: HNH endonuclease signature motif containing protein [Pseudomonas aeruginosa]